MYPVYRDIQNWVILDNYIIHDYTDDEKEILIVNVLIGTLHYKQVNWEGKEEDKRTPITRWITKNQYYKYMEQI